MKVNMGSDSPRVVKVEDLLPGQIGKFLNLGNHYDGEYVLVTYSDLVLLKGPVHTWALSDIPDTKLELLPIGVEVKLTVEV